MARACGFARLAASARPLPARANACSAKTSLSATFIAAATAEREAIVKNYSGKTGFTQSQVNK
jgi:hypothetical protein